MRLGLPNVFFFNALAQSVLTNGGSSLKPDATRGSVRSFALQIVLVAGAPRFFIGALKVVAGIFGWRYSKPNLPNCR
jgi:hypothetical protein